MPSKPQSSSPTDELTFDNGLGGMTADGREYVIRIAMSQDAYVLPPAPWINVIANPDFGTIVSENVCGFTWRGNSQSNRLTPWHNDPISDAPSEIAYLQDERGEIWTATPDPLGKPASFRVRHGQGYTIFEHARQELQHELSVFVPIDQPVKLMRLKIRNSGNRTRKLSLTFFAEWVLGRTREQMSMHVVTEVDPDSGAILARSAFRPDYSNRVAFADISARPRTFTADRVEFLGRNGDRANPGLAGGSLSGKIGAALDPCVAVQTQLTIPAGKEIEVVFVMGEAENAAEAGQLSKRFRDTGEVQHVWDQLIRHWDDFFSRVAIRTPNQALNHLVNRWLPYQVLSCRMWARSALYQSGGAFGFRDQLQDSLALLYAKPEATRAHILLAASRQFVEGDVQHWWHPPSGAGVRTRFSDDYLWLPFVVEAYVRITGDKSLLDERVPYLQAPRLQSGQHEDYRVPTIADESGSVYEHCTRSIEHGLRFGSHGLPLMGTGDWNDGMNLVGGGGKGESVWTGWFLLKVARDFASICEMRNDRERAQRFRDEAATLGRNLEEHAWDGNWYRRAFFDDGARSASHVNDECRLDSIVQSWAVISGAARSGAALAKRCLRSTNSWSDAAKNWCCCSPRPSIAARCSRVMSRATFRASAKTVGNTLMLPFGWRKRSPKWETAIKRAKSSTY